MIDWNEIAWWVTAYYAAGLILELICQWIMARRKVCRLGVDVEVEPVGLLNRLLTIWVWPVGLLALCLVLTISEKE